MGNIVIVGIHDLCGTVLDGVEIAQHFAAVVVPWQLFHDSERELLLLFGREERAVGMFQVLRALKVSSDDDVASFQGRKAFNGLTWRINRCDDDMAHF